MKDMPFWLASGPDMTGTAAGIGTASAVGRRGRRQRKAEVFMVVTKVSRRLERAWLERWGGG